MVNYNLFGEIIEEKELLRDKFIEPPFSVLDSKSGNWVRRKRKWLSLGIKSECGRNAKFSNMKNWSDEKREQGLLSGNKLASDISIFDPALCEVLYKWFVPNNGTILDTFAGGSVRGIVANYLGYKYTGIDIRPEQIESNYEQSKKILELDNQPCWLCGDSNKVLDNLDMEFDFVFSCPPYAYLEVYSDLEGDISNMKYQDFLVAYKSIISKSCKWLKKDGFACFVVGEVRDKEGNYIGLVPDTINAFKEIGMKFYNEAIYLQQLGSAAVRANGNMASKKLVKVHQNILVFKK